MSGWDFVRDGQKIEAANVKVLEVAIIDDPIRMSTTWYKAIGNSIAVNVMRWIGERIESVEAI